MKNEYMPEGSFEVSGQQYLNRF